MEQTIQELQELRSMAALLAVEIEKREAEIKSFMDSRHLEALEGEGYKITWKAVTSTRFDSQRFKAEYPLLYQSYGKETTARRFVVM